LRIESDWQALLRGEKRAWDDFVREAAPLVRAVARRVLAPMGREEALPDVVQETFVSLCRDDFNLLRRFDRERASLVTYLGVIASRRAVDHLRRTEQATVAVESVADELLAVLPAEPARALNFPDDLLTPRQTLILRLRYERDLEVEEISRILGISPQTVRSLHHKALVRLRAQLASETGGLGDVPRLRRE